MHEKFVERGNQLFASKITPELDKILTDSSKKDIFQFLIKHFADKVAPMELGDGIYAANRLANACIEIVYNSNCSIDDTDSLLKGIMEVYSNSTVGTHKSVVTNSSVEVDNVTKELYKELQDNADKMSKNVVVDLIWDIPVDELDVEGKRVRGLLPSNFDSTVDGFEEEYESDIEPDVIAVVMVDENNELTLMCPKCNSTNLVLESITGCCMDCDCEFNLPINIEDSIERSIELKDPKSDISGGITRTKGPKKNRGIIIESED